MPVESATYATQFDTSSPASTDPRSEGDDHLRLIKAVLNTELGAGFNEWAYTALTATWRSTTRVSFDTDQTGVFEVGRRVRAAGSATGTLYGEVASATYSASTSVNFRWDESSLSNEAIQFWVGSSRNNFPYAQAPGSPVDLRQYGAVLEQTSTHNTAWSSAISKARGVLYVPAGQWQVTAQHEIGSGLKILGAGSGKTIIDNQAGDYAFHCATAVSHVQIAGVELASGSNGGLLHCENAFLVRLEEFKADNRSNGVTDTVKLDSCFNVVVSDMQILGGTYGIQVTSPKNSSNIVIEHGLIQQQSAAAVYIPAQTNTLDNLRITGIGFSAATLAADTIGIYLKGGNVFCVQIDSCHFEDFRAYTTTGRGILVGDGVKALSINECYGTKCHNLIEFSAGSNGVTEVEIDQVYLTNAGIPEAEQTVSHAVVYHTNVANVNEGMIRGLNVGSGGNSYTTGTPAGIIQYDITSKNWRVGHTWDGGHLQMGPTNHIWFDGNSYPRWDTAEPTSANAGLIVVGSEGTTGASATPAGHIEMTIGATTYKIIHQGTV